MSPKDLQRNHEHFLTKFFEPESIAIVGASNNPMRANYSLLSNLLKLGFKGRIYPVHPSEKEILGVKAYPAVKDIPEIVDLAVIGVSYAMAPGGTEVHTRTSESDLRQESLSAFHGRRVKAHSQD